MFWSTVTAFAGEVVALFVAMAPYLLLGIGVAGLLSVVVRRSFVARHVGRSGFASIAKASILGVPLPLCSCSVLPTSIYLKRSGASRPAVVSFLMSTPQTGVDSIAATYGLLGPLFAIFRPVAALLTGLLGGAATVATGGAEWTERDEIEPATETRDQRGLLERLRDAARYAATEALDDLALRFLFGLLIAALISLLVPPDFFAGRVFGSGLPAMLLAVAIGIPMYVCATSSIPIALALLAAGLSPGAAYVFLVAGPATNAATVAVLGRVLGRKQTVIYVAVLIVAALAFGVVMDLIATGTGWIPPVANAMHHQGAAWWEIGGAVVLGLLIGASVVRQGLVRRRRRMALGEAKTGGPTTAGSVTGSGAAPVAIGAVTPPTAGETSSPDTGAAVVAPTVIAYQVTGMTCNGCAAHVESAASNVPGAEQVTVDLGAGTMQVTGSAESEAVSQAVHAAGYQARPLGA